MKAANLTEMAKSIEATNANYFRQLAIARTMTVANIRLALKQRECMYVWAVDAYEQALKEALDTRNLRRATRRK